MQTQALANQEFCFAGPANPFTDTWVKATPNLYKRMADAYDSDPSRGITWWNITLNVVGEAYVVTNPLPVDVDGAAALCSLAQNSGNRHSILKCQLTYPLGNTKTRTIRFDIGSGIDIVIPPTWKIDAIFLRPDAPVGGPVPVGFDADAFFISDFIITARCVAVPLRLPEGIWTDQFVITDPGAPTRDFEVQEGAVAISANFSIPPANPIQFIWQRRLPDGTLLDETVLGLATAAAASTSIDRTSIPGGTNILRYSQPLGPFPIQGSIKQHLEF